MIEQWDFLIRIIALGAALMLLALVAANDARPNLFWPMLGMIVGVIGYLINSTPLIAPQGMFDPWVDLVSISTTFFIWVFSRNLFERPIDRRAILAAVAVMVLSWFAGNFLPFTRPVGFFVIHIVSLLLIADIVRVGVFERADDLVEDRRTIRLWLPLLVAAQAGAILSFEIIEVVAGLDGRGPIAQLINSLLITVLILFSGIALMRSDRELLVHSQRKAVGDEEPKPLDLSPSEAVLNDKLQAALARGVHREQGLSITRLADHLETPEHRLRALINGQLGYRNFSAFLNRHRIAEAKQKLADRDDVDLPVLTIAMDLGYNSLPTFNRAFRSETETTPSEYRRLAILQNGIEPQKTLVKTEKSSAFSQMT